MTNYNELRDGQEFYANGYKKGYEDALNNYSDWLKKQTTGFDYNRCEVLVDRNGIWENAIETYLKESSLREMP